MTNTFPPGAVELSSATSAFSEMNGDGLCGAWEVLMLRPIESLLLLQPGYMMKCHLSDHPLSPTYRLHSIYLTVSLGVAPVLCLVAPSYLLFFFTSLSTFFPLHLAVCPYFSFSLHGSL